MRKRWLLIVGGLSVLAGAAVVWPRTLTRAEVPVTRQAPPPRFDRLDVTALADAGLALSGEVVDVRGQPVPGAEVLLVSSAQPSLISVLCDACRQPLLSCPARESALHVRELLRQRQGALSAALVTRADAKGRFRFERLAGVSFNIWAQAPGFGAGLRERAAPGETARVVMPAPRALSGEVRDELGRPVGGARVHAVSRRLALPVETVTDGRGAFELAGLGEGPFYVLADKDGWLPGTSAQVDAGGAPVQLTLTEPRSLEVALTSGGKPAEGRVQLKGDHLSRDGTTREGVARFDNLYPDALVASASSSNKAAAARTLTLEGRTTRVSMELEAGGTLSVTVVDDAGLPVPAARLVLATQVSEVVLERAAHSGELVPLGPLALGDYELHVSAEGYGPVELPVTVKGGDTPVEVVLPRGNVLSGRVLDEYGRAIPGVGLSALPIQETVYTDAEGRFSFAVPNRGLYVLEAHHSDWGGARVEVTAPASGVEVRLEARAGVEVRVRANGQGVEGASLVLWGGGSTFHSDRPSDADGRVVMRGIPPGTYALSADHPRFLPSEKRQVTLEDGKPLSVTVDLREGAPLLGEVVDERGRPVPGVWVSAFPEGASPATTDGAGRFKLEPLWPERPYRLEARHPRYELRERALVQPGGERVRLVLREKTRVHGRVVDEDGVPIKRFEVDTEAVSTADGRFEVFTSPTEDGETLIISAPGHEPAIVDVPGSKNLGDVVLPRSPRLTGVVRDEHGGPVADAVVGCSSCDVQATTDEQGRFSLPRAAGDRSVSVVARRGRLSGTREVSNPSAPAEVVIRQSVRLTGRVFLPDGSPAAGKQVEAFEGDRSELVAFVTGADGSFSADVPPGSYRIPVNPGVGDMGVPLLFVRVDGAEKRLDLGPAPGTGSLTVRVDQQPGYALWVVPGTLSQVGEPPMELMKLPYGQMVYQPESGTVRVQGLAPGRYTVVWASHHANTPGGPVVRTVDVGGPTELSLVR